MQHETQGTSRNRFRKWANRRGRRKISFGSKQTVLDFAELRSEMTKRKGHHTNKWANHKGHLAITLESEQNRQEHRRITLESDGTARDVEREQTVRDIA
jgi:hypothetical protein